MKMQDYFDKAYHGLKSQNFRKSYNDDTESCVYYDEDANCRCAFGWVLTDEDLDYIVGNDLNSDTDYGSLPEKIKNKYTIEDYHDTYEFFGKLQNAHDDSYSEKSMKRNLEDFAFEFGLKYPEE